MSSQEKTTMTEAVSGSSKSWREIREDQGWDDFLAWCRDQENSPHE